MKGERQQALAAAFRRLSDVEKQCVYARAYGLTLAQIAEVVGIEATHVAAVLDRAIAALERDLKRDP